MKIPYCTCKQHSPEIFNNAALAIGIFLLTILVPFLIILGVIADDVTVSPGLLLGAVLVLLWLWQRHEYKRQALYLGHSKDCARRYALLAATSTVRGYDPRYRSGLKTYKSSLRSFLIRKFGKRKVRMLVIGGWTFVAAAMMMVSLFFLTE